MLKIITIKLLAKNLIFVSKGNTINKVDCSDSKVSRAKSKNMVMPNILAKSKLFVKPMFGLGFFIFGARLVLVKLRQAFIESLILHYFDLKYYICVKIDVLGFIIGRVFN